VVRYLALVLPLSKDPERGCQRWGWGKPDFRHDPRQATKDPEVLRGGVSAPLTRTGGPGGPASVPLQVRPGPRRPGKIIAVPPSAGTCEP